MRLKGETALVTGGGRGIGAAIARRLAEEGAGVVVVDRNEAGAQATTEAIRGAGGKATALTADVSTESGVEEMASNAIRQVGSISILINNAGIPFEDTPAELTMAGWRRCMAVDLEGAWLCARALLPSMRNARRGAIVNIASVHSFQVLKRSFPYGVAKHGIIGLTRTLAIEYAAEGIRCNAVCPGYIDTPNLDEMLSKHPDPDGIKKNVAALHPPQRIGTPQDVANAVLFLASGEAAFVNGISLMVDGGRSLVYHD
jgi:NAD(P)-dependent dehydrogenase (short-subunit alcohol dehydrogenase family)